MLRTVLAITLLAPTFAVTAEPDAKKVEFFETKIRPVLVEQCYKCHSAAAEKEKKLRGDLFLDSKVGLAKGGESARPSFPGSRARAS